MKDRSLHSRKQAANIKAARYRRDGGYLLLAIMLMMVFMIIAATVAAPRIIQQMKRDREAEMIHRGTEYARAIKKFYKKNGRYPASLDDLDKGQVKYLRRRYKDPLTKDGKWKLLNYGDIASLLNTATPGTPAAALGTAGGNATPGSVFSSSSSPTGFGSSGSNSFGSQQQPQPQQQQQQGNYNNNGFPSNSDTGGTSGESVPTGGGNFSGSDSGFNSGSPTGSSSGSGTSNPAGSNSSNSNNQQSGTTFGSNSGNNQTFGGGAVVGVASQSKDPTIRIYNKKKTYNEWQFIYNPMMDQNNVLLRGPYQPTTIGSQNIGTPAGQMNGQQQNQNQSPFAQPNSSGFGQSNGVGTSPQPSSSH
jgi:type II secretory pathway pseudopilin PulG